MKLAYWMYAGPAHIGTLRVASSFKNVHAIMHAPLGDDYFNVMRSMLERERDFTPVTASIVDRHVLARGSQEKVVENITRKNKEEFPDLVLLTPTCTSSILQEDLHNFVERSTIALTPANPSSPDKDKMSNVYGERKDKKNEGQGVQNNSNNNTPIVLGAPRLKTIIQPSDSSHKKPIYCEEGGDLEPLGQSADVILADVNHYRVNELQAADRTLEQIVRFYIEKAKKQKNLNTLKTTQPSVNIIGIFTLGFHNQHDCRELKRLFNDLGITINEIIPEGGCVNNLKNLPKAWFNFVPYREVGLMTAVYLKSEFNMPYISTTPMGLVDTSACIREIAQILEQQKTGPVPEKGNSPNSATEAKQHSSLLPIIGSGDNGVSGKPVVVSTTADRSLVDAERHPQTLLTKYLQYIDEQTRFVSQAAWFSRSIDCQNLTGKKAVVFGDATHSAAMTKILSREMGIRVICAGTYCKHDADWFREQVAGFCDQILITDDHTQVGDMIALLEPSAIFGTQMERHVGKRLDIPCGVISAPVHIQNFPLGYRPFLGYEGANQIADLVYNSFSLGMEEHLLQIFGGHDNQVLGDQSERKSNLLDGDILKSSLPTHERTDKQATTVKLEETIIWSPDGLVELNKVPGFVRGKVKRNTEKYAEQNQIKLITVEIMYAAKEALTT